MTKLNVIRDVVVAVCGLLNVMVICGSMTYLVCYEKYAVVEMWKDLTHSDIEMDVNININR